MRFYKKLVGDKCYLSPISEQDAEQWAIWFNNLEITIPLGDEAYTPTNISNQLYIISDMTKHNAHFFNIVSLKNDELIGRCGLYSLDRVNRHAKFGIVIGEKSYWNKGFGQDATKLMLDYGFNLLNLNNIMLGVFFYNKSAISCYKKVGFKEIGRHRQAKIIAGKKYDIVLMDMLAEEFTSIFVNKLIK